jgi:hypothetical protein
MRKPLALAIALAALAGCATTYPVWVPTQHATTQLPDTGAPAATYSMPAGAPSGNVQVASLGVQRIKDGAERKQLVVRMVVTNNSDQTWRVDPKQQVVTFADGQQRQPDLAFSSQQAASQTLEVAAGQHQSIDLLYDVPQAKHGLDHYQLAWSVDTTAQVVSDRTSFQRQEVKQEADGSYASYYGDYGDYGYYGDYYGYGDYYYPPPYFYPYPFYSFGFGGPFFFNRPFAFRRPFVHRPFVHRPFVGRPFVHPGFANPHVFGRAAPPMHAPGGMRGGMGMHGGMGGMHGGMGGMHGGMGGHGGGGGHR